MQGKMSLKDEQTRVWYIKKKKNYIFPVSIMYLHGIIIKRTAATIYPGTKYEYINQNTNKGTLKMPTSTRYVHNQYFKLN